jgi:hypothetical protein
MCTTYHVLIKFTVQNLWRNQNTNQEIILMNTLKMFSMYQP